MKSLPIDAFCQYHFLSAPTLSPDGTKAVYVDKVANKKENNYDSVLKLIRFGTAGDLSDTTLLNLTNTGRESSFIFDDDETLLLPLNRRKEDKPEKNHEKNTFYRLPLGGGEAAPAFVLDYNAGGIQKIQKGLYAFSCEKDLNRPDPDDKDKADELKDYDDYHVLEELPYWTDNGGFISRFRSALYLYDEKENKVTCLTEEPLFDLRSFTVTENKIYYSGEAYDAIRPHTSGLYVYDIENKTTTTLIPEKTRILGQMAASKNGLYITMMKEGVTSYWGTNDLYFYDGTSFKLLCDQMPAVGDGPSSDSTLGFSRGFKVRNEKLYFTALVRTETKLFCIDAGSAASETTAAKSDADKATDAASATDFSALTEIPLPVPVQQYDIQGNRIVMTVMKEGTLQEIYAMSDPLSDAVQLTHVNEAILEDTYIAPCRYAGFVNSDDIEIDGWVLEPRDFDPAKKYPAILDIHGGPRGAYGTVFFHEMQYFANEGYFVLFCNPRGSSGRGDEFADIRKKYGTIDYQDLMEFVDHCLEAFPAIDSERLGVTGGSYGGWMTNWILGHTDRFKAAASQRSFSNWLSDFSASEIGFSFDVAEIGALPWEDPKRLWWASPAAYVDKIVTPTLFIHSLMDHNCPLSESMQMFAAMRYRGIPARACLFEGEGHGLSRGGKPRHRIRRLKEITEWMDKYLKA